MEIIYFFIGIGFFYTKAMSWLGLLAGAWFVKPSWSVLIGFILAIAYCLFHEWFIQETGIPQASIISKAHLEGKITSLVADKGNKTQFQYQADRLNDKPIQLNLSLSCYENCPNFQIGERWSLEAKLKKPMNLGNPGAFDYVGWLKARHIDWVGYIKKNSAIRLEAAKPGFNLLRLRESLGREVAQLIPNLRSSAVFNALTLGLTSGLDKKDWDLFRRTGTTHLMVISGAHIGLIAGLSFSLVCWLWSRISRFCLYYPAPKVGSIFGFLMALSYALIAGFAAPAQRALVVCFFVFLKNFLRISFARWQAWRYSLLAVLLWEPHVVLLPGFYLSFIAVALLLIGNQLIPWKGWKKVICLQLICLFGLMPFTLYWFSYGAMNGIAANLLAIPLVGLVIVPLSLLNLALIPWIKIPALFIPVHYAIEALFYYLKAVDSFSQINLTFELASVGQVFALMLGMFIILCFRFQIIIPAWVILMYAGLFPGYPRVQNKEVELNVLDVGQGLAIVIRTAKHTLIYDTGAKFYRGGDMAQLAIIPFLKRIGTSKLDKIIISHPDLDHRGGLESLEAEYKPDQLIVNDVNFYHRGFNCHNYPPWEWDGVSFEFLGIQTVFKSKNNNSCILKIQNKAGKVLLTGDIEKLAEHYLVSEYKEKLKSNILVVAHHGSKTSSSAAFIKQVAPEFALISAGFANRYHFPHQQTLNTLQNHGANIINTMNCGMITTRLGSDTGAIQNLCYQVKN